MTTTMSNLYRVIAPLVALVAATSFAEPTCGDSGGPGYWATRRLEFRRRKSFARLITIAAPIETVVDPHLHHLDVAVPHKESVSREPLEPKRSNECPVVQPQKVILHLRRPIGQESPLDARAHQPAAIAVVGGGD